MVVSIANHRLETAFSFEDRKGCSVSVRGHSFIILELFLKNKVPLIGIVRGAAPRSCLAFADQKDACMETLISR